MENDRIKKRAAKKKTSTLKNKLLRSDTLEGVLASKVQQSIERARFVQGARKAGWDQINKGINAEKPVPVKEAEDVDKEAQIEQEEEDQYVAEFYGKKPEESGPKNAFELLGSVLDEE